MPALRSLCTASILAACLAQAWAGPSDTSLERREGGYGGFGGGQGGGQGQGYGGGDQGQWQDYQPQNPGDMQKNQDQGVVVTVTETMMMTVTAPAPEQKNAPPETITVTAVAPCDSNVVTATAYVTSCPAAGAPPSPESCMPCSAGMMWPSVPANAGGLGNCPVMSTSIPNFTPGLSSIPASEAVVTGVAKAAVPEAAAAAASGSWAPSGPPAGAPAPTISLVSAAALSAGPSVGGGGMWAAPGAYSAEGAGAWTMFLGSTFITTGSISPGLSSIPNTMAWPAGAAAVPTPPAPPMVSPGIFASGAAPEVPSGTTTTTSTVASPSSTEKKVVISSSPVTSSPETTAAAAVSISTSTTTIQTMISHGNYGILGIGKRFVVPKPTAWS